MHPFADTIGNGAILQALETRPMGEPIGEDDTEIVEQRIRAEMKLLAIFEQRHAHVRQHREISVGARFDVGLQSIAALKVCERLLDLLGLIKDPPDRITIARTELIGSQG